MTQVFRSKVDTWLGIVLVAAALAALYGVIHSLNSGDNADIVASLFALLVSAGLPIWLINSTRYTLTEQQLLVKSGPFQWQIPIVQISNITPTINPLSSPALSLDRLRIDYGQGRSLMISPKQQQQFLQALLLLRADKNPLSQQ
ncbi:PH domain-containing protein [Alishewanella sp. 16-MA]|uniref:PH domain-containing protein n=1 Tax=Alishewanella maricola TaxID=2795740 RepID=A0ABS8C7Z2_9ALTE|nr:PH domain-containing protein [Alishewanella maricola]MCB5228065.1 PH domain-containing protein [Alishewanella maricola]